MSASFVTLCVKSLVYLLVEENLTGWMYVDLAPKDLASYAAISQLHDV